MEAGGDQEITRAIFTTKDAVSPSSRVHVPSMIMRVVTLLPHKTGTVNVPSAAVVPSNTFVQTPLVPNTCKCATAPPMGDLSGKVNVPVIVVGVPKIIPVVLKVASLFRPATT